MNRLRKGKIRREGSERGGKRVLEVGVEVPRQKFGFDKAGANQKKYSFTNEGLAREDQPYRFKSVAK